MEPIIFYTHSNYGDTLEQLNFLRRLANRYPYRSFIQYTKQTQISQLQEVVEDLPCITLKDVQDHPPNAVCSWIAHDGFMHRHPTRNQDRVGFLLQWFKHLAECVGLPNPITRMEDLLFDTPTLMKKIPAGATADILMINSTPQSGQFRGYNPERLGALAQKLAEKQSVITTEKVDGLPCTRDFGLTLAGIGNLSRKCRAVAGVATGPIWLTMNVHNHGKVDYFYMVDLEHINYGDRYFKADSDFHAEHLMTEMGYL